MPPKHRVLTVQMPWHHEGWNSGEDNRSAWPACVPPPTMGRCPNSRGGRGRGPPDFFRMAMREGGPGPPPLSFPYKPVCPPSPANRTGPVLANCDGDTDTPHAFVINLRIPWVQDWREPLLALFVPFQGGGGAMPVCPMHDVNDLCGFCRLFY